MLKIRKTKPLTLWSKIEENQKLFQLSNCPSGCFVSKVGFGKIS